MSEAPAVEQFEDDLNAVIDRYRLAHLLTLAETVGTLHIVATGLIANALDEEEDEE